jgi:hypothetical protein
VAAAEKYLGIWDLNSEELQDVLRPLAWCRSRSVAGRWVWDFLDVFLMKYWYIVVGLVGGEMYMYIYIYYPFLFLYNVIEHTLPHSRWRNAQTKCATPWCQIRRRRGSGGWLCVHWLVSICFYCVWRAWACVDAWYVWYVQNNSELGIPKSDFSVLNRNGNSHNKRGSDWKKTNNLNGHPTRNFNSWTRASFQSSDFSP